MYIFPPADERAKALLPLHVITVGTDFDQKPVNRSDGNPFHHIFFVEKGEGCFQTAAGTLTAGEGTVIYMRKGVPIHYVRAGGCFRTGWVTFDGPFVDALLSYFHAQDFEQLQSDRLTSLLRDCAKAAGSGASPAVLSQLAYELIVSFFAERDRGQRHTALDRAVTFMREHYADDLSVAEIAGAAGVSESLLYRLFREREGITPVEYLRRVRIERAKRYLLESPELKIGRIAALCGFADVAYFCKVFRDSERVTPKTYRAMM